MRKHRGGLPPDRSKTVKKASGQYPKKEREDLKGSRNIYTVAFILFCAGLSVRIYYLGSPIRYDEAFTFLNYALLPFTDAVADYSFPNNHIFHTLLVKCSTILFGPWEWAIRFPAFIAGLGLLPLMFVLGRRVGGNRTGLWVLALAVSSSPLIEYSTNGRGYSIICLCTALLLVTADRISTAKSQVKTWTLYILSAVAGLFTVPIMLYPLCLVSVWLLLQTHFISKDRQTAVFLRLSFSGLIIIIGTLLCYTPAILHSGIKSLVSNRFVQPLPFFEFLGKLPDLSQELFLYYNKDYPLFMTILMTIGFILGCLRVPALVTAGLITVLPLMILQRIIPYPRVFTFGIVIYLLVVARGLEAVLDRLLKNIGPQLRNYISFGAPVIWALAGICFTILAGGPLSSIDRFPEAERAATFLTKDSDKQDFYIASVPAIEPIRYYGSKRGTENIETDLPNHLFTKVFIVVNRRTETMQTLYNRYSNMLQFFGRPEQIAAFDSTEIYLADGMNLEDIRRNGTLFNSKVSEFIDKLKSNKVSDPITLRFLSYAGWFYIQLKEFNLATQVYEQILKIEENNEIALHARGRIYHEESRLDSAEYYYKRVLQKNARHVSTLINMGMIKSQKGDLDSAKQYYTQALEVDSTNFEAIFDLGNLFYSSGALDQAEKYFRLAKQIKPEDGMVHLALGAIYHKLYRNNRLALEEFKSAAERLPELADTIQQHYILPLIDNSGEPVDTGNKEIVKNEGKSGVNP